jgi:hypothetical protein
MSSGSDSNAKLGPRVQLRWDQPTCGTILVNIAGHNEEIGFRIDSGVFRESLSFVQEFSGGSSSVFHDSMFDRVLGEFGRRSQS